MKEFIVKCGDVSDMGGGYIMVDCDTEELVRCKDCKHKPIEITYKNAVGAVQTFVDFPKDSKCPCQNTSDTYYSWCPDDNWFCAEGEKRT